jgi:hypothetical protein
VGPDRFLDPCLPTLLVVSPDATDDERAGIAAALQLWSAVGGPSISLEGPSGAQPLPIGFERAAPAFFGLYRPDHGDILINRGLVDPTSRAITIAHEVGHAFGLAHVNGQRSLMNPGNLVIPPGEREVQLIGERRGPCPAP